MSATAKPALKPANTTIPRTLSEILGQSAGAPRPGQFPRRPDPAPRPVIMVTQSGGLDCGPNSGHNQPVIGGDSDLPIFIWPGNDRFPMAAISGSGPIAPQLQDAVNTSSRLMGVSPANHQVQHLDVSPWPNY